MLTLPESFLGILGPIRPLLADDTVVAITLHGTESAWVERAGAPPRGMEPVGADMLARIVEAVAGRDGRADHGALAALPTRGSVRVQSTQAVKGGALVVFHAGRVTPADLAQLGPRDVVDTVRRALFGGLSVLVVGAQPDQRISVLASLWEGVPMDRRRAVVEAWPSGIPPLGALSLVADGDTLAARTAEMAAWLRLGFACIPELHALGMHGLRAAGAVGHVLASAAGQDAHGALSGFHAYSVTAGEQVRGLFQLVVELGVVPDTRALTIRALVDARTAHEGTTWWHASGDAAGAWSAAPAWAWRVPATLPGAYEDPLAEDPGLPATRKFQEVSVELDVPATGATDNIPPELVPTGMIEAPTAELHDSGGSPFAGSPSEQADEWAGAQPTVPAMPSPVVHVRAMQPPPGAPPPPPRSQPQDRRPPPPLPATLPPPPPVRRGEPVASPRSQPPPPPPARRPPLPADFDDSAVTDQEKARVSNVFATIKKDGG